MNAHNCTCIIMMQKRKEKKKLYEAKEANKKIKYEIRNKKVRQMRPQRCGKS